MYVINIKRPYQQPVFHIETDNQNLYDTLKTAYGPFICDKTSPEDEIFTMHFLKSDDQAGEGIELQIIENNLYSLTKIKENFLALHSAVVEKSGKAYLFLGATQAGKSTLTAYLCNNGLNYYSDDIAIIDQNTLRVYPYPRAIQLRDGGAEVLKNNGINLDDCPVFSYGDIKRIVLTPKLPASSVSSAEIGGIFFIKRSETENSAEPMPVFKSFSALMESLYVYEKTSVQLISLIKKLCGMKIYSINYKDMDFVKKWIEQM